MNLPVYFYIFVIYLAIVFIVGLIAGLRHKITSLEEWGTAGRSLNVLVNYFTAHATQLSALQYMGFVSFMYMFGYVVFQAHYIMYMLTTCAFFVLFSVKIWRLGKKYGHMTPTDLLVYYYGQSKLLAYIVAGLLFLALIPYLQIQVTAAGYLFQIASGGSIPFWVGAVTIYILVMIYTWIGGLRSVAYTDAIQGALLFFGLWFGGALIIWKFGGGVFNVFSTAAQQIPQKVIVSGYKGWDWLWAITWGIPLGFGWAAHAHMWLRNYTPKDETSARFWPFILLTNNIITGMIMVCAALSLSIAFPGQEAIADKLFMMKLQEVLNPWVYGLILAGAISAMLSTVDSQVHALSLVIVRDFIEKSGIKLSEKMLVNVSRATVVISMALGLALAFTAPGYLAWIGGYAASFGLILLPAIICALTAQKWVTRTGVIAGILGGTFAMIITSVGSLKNACGIYFGFWGFVVDIVLLCVVSLLTPDSRPSEETVKTMKEIGW